MAVHVVYITQTPVLNGIPIDKESATIKEVINSDTEMRIVPDASVPNSSGKPSIKEYIELENAAGFKLGSITNTMIVTQT